MPRSILILHKKKERKKGEKVVIDEIARRIETTKRTKNGGAWKKGGRKMVQVAHRQITLLPIPSSASLPFFPPEERRSTCNSSSRSSRRFPRFRKRPRWFVRSFDSRQGSKSLASPGNGHLETRPKEWTHREPPRVGQTFRAILVNNSLFLQG